MFKLSRLRELKKLYTDTYVCCTKTFLYFVQHGHVFSLIDFTNLIYKIQNSWMSDLFFFSFSFSCHVRKSSSTQRTMLLHFILSLEINVYMIPLITCIFGRPPLLLFQSESYHTILSFVNLQFIKHFCSQMWIHTTVHLQTKFQQVIFHV